MLISSGLLGQSVCTTANNGSTACSSGNGGSTLGTIIPTSSWQSVAITSVTTNNYEFNATAGQVYEFATCTGQNMELTIYRYVSAASSNILQYDQNKECPGCTTGCTQGADDEYAKIPLLRVRCFTVWRPVQVAQPILMAQTNGMATHTTVLMPTWH